MKLDLIVGARPNFMKIAPIIDAIEQARKNGSDMQYRLVHTGQHYDKKMSHEFFVQLGIPEPHVNLEAGGGTQAEQTAAIMVRYEKALTDQLPDMVLVVGDVTSTMACSITAKKMNNIPVAHVEAGIRSGDLTMPEEINRIVTDSITDYFFTTSETANNHLRSAGISDHRIFFVGNTMIDSLLKHKKSFRKPAIWDALGLENSGYAVMTLHRPSNVDDPEQLKDLMTAITGSCGELPIIFPVHPRTVQRLEQIGVASDNLHLVEPLGYLEFNYLIQHAKVVITDSGGITEETTVMNVPCITLRNNTERPETCSFGTNELVGTAPARIREAIGRVLSGQWKKGGIPPLWDGKAASRIVDHLIQLKK